MRQKGEATEQKVSTPREVLDTLLNYKLDVDSVNNAEVAIKTVCEATDSFEGKETGFRLIKITNDKKSNLHLINKSAGRWYPFTILTWTINEKIEKGIEAKALDSGDEDILQWMSTTTDDYRNKNEGFDAYPDDMIDYIIADSLMGQVVSKKRFTDQCEFMSSNGKTKNISISKQTDGSTTKELNSIFEHFNSVKELKRKEIREIISAFAKKLECDPLRLNVVHNCIKSGAVYIGKITKVLQGNNTRTYQIKILPFDGMDEIKQSTLVATAKAGVQGDALKLSNLEDLWMAETRPWTYDDAKITNFGRMPYNFVDEGRIILSIPRHGGHYDIIIGPDPRIDKEPIEHIKTVLEKYVDVLTKNLTKLTGTTIIKGKIHMNYDSFESAVSKDSTEVKPLQIRLKALKKMVDEYKYIVQKQKAVGSDVNISDKIKYNHSEGKVSYNDFSIAIDDELLKQRLFQTFESYLITYYRGETSEETILNDILDKIFTELKNRVNSYSAENSVITIKLNDCIEIKLEIKTTANKAKLTYLNGQRFNRNEVLTVLRELTCYRSQEEANKFISNIGKLGLSVYIGMTSGYELKLGSSNKLFRFKKLKGRSKYVMILDTIEIPIKGKELVNILFAKFIGEQVTSCEDKIQKIIFESVESSKDYVRYKFLIDSAYEAFKERSQAFLTKKVTDVQGEFCSYWNSKGNRNMTAITLVGMSGHRYIIAYDNKDSYVFIDPELKKGAKNVYENGKYVCMIDQSNIKSNIGYDTVISKLLALKNDSVIAGTIYNLEEELSE